MAHHVEPMDVDCSDSDNKENTYHHNNVLPCTEKGYEELDVSELNMKLRYSMTPASSPMSKSYTACLDNRSLDTDDLLNFNNENGNFTRSLNSTLTKNDSVIKSLKILPSHALSNQEFVQDNGNPSVLRQLDSTITHDGNITVAVSGDIDENVSLPSSSSSALQTPEATTPTKEIAKDGSSPIMRGLKSVFNMFRSSQSPIPPVESDNAEKQEICSPADNSITKNTTQAVVASTPIAAGRSKDGNTSKRSSPYKDSIVFNEDLEKELNWKEETTILFSEEKIPVHKLFLQQNKSTPARTDVNTQSSNKQENFNSTVEYMDISYNESLAESRSVAELQQDNKHEVIVAAESDSEFVDCETTLTNVSQLLEWNEPDVSNISQTIINAHNLDLIKKIDNAPTVNSPTKFDITGLSITEEETNDKTPSDYSDYSKETTELLTELEKFEENVTLMKETSEVAVNQPEIILEKEATDQHNKTHEFGTTNTTHQDNLVHFIKTTESQEKLLDVTEIIKEKQIDNTPAVEENISIIKPVETSVPDIVQYMESKVELEKEITELQALTEINRNQDNANIGLTNITAYTQIPKTDRQTLDMTIETDLNNTKSPGLSDNTLLLCTGGSKFCSDENVDVVPAVMKNLLPNKIMPMMTNICQTEMTAGVPQTVGDLSNESEQEYLEISVLVKEKPSDIPLSDEKEIDREITTGEKVLTIIPDTVPIMRLVTEAKLDVIHDYEDHAPGEKLDVSHDEDQAPVVKDEIGNDIIEIINVTYANDVVQSSEHLEAMKTESKMNIETIGNISQDSAPDIPIGNNDMGPKSCNALSLQTMNITTPELLNNTSTILNLGVTESSDKQNYSKTQVDNDLELTEKFTDLNHTNDNIADDIPQVDNDSVTKSLNVPVVKDKLEQTCSEDHPEPMDITMNESLKQAHDLPDLVNQTIVITEEISNAEMTSNIANVKRKHEEQTSSTGNKVFDDFEKLSETKIVKDVESNLIFKTESDNLENNTTDQLNKKPIEDQNHIMINDFQLVNKTESIQPNSVKIEEDKLNESNANSQNEVNMKNASNVEEEIKISPNNSPYASLTAEVDTVSEKVEKPFEEIETTFVPNINTSSSPPITSKGYNFNFDEIDDPFTTKTKIRLSPPLDTPTKLTLLENVDRKQFVVPKTKAGNRRKSQPSDRKKQSAIIKKFNQTFDATTEGIKDEAVTEINSETSETKLVKEITPIKICKQLDATQILQEKTKDLLKSEENSIQISEKPPESSIEIKFSNDSLPTISSEIKNTSSSEHSVYYSAGASSTESVQSKNVFNLPEIDDANFNPFATKSKMRLSPPLGPETENPFHTNTQLTSSPDTSKIAHPQPDLNSTVIHNADLAHATEHIDSDDKMETELMEKETIVNVSNATSLSKDTDNQNTTIHDTINTEDEDTIEGPFLEIDNIVDKIPDFEDGNTDMIQFNDLPAQAADDDNLGGELFIDAEAYEFLLNQNPKNVVSDSGKESLFLKFDPLLAKRISSDGVLTALSNIEKKQSTPTKPTRLTFKNEASPIAACSTFNITYEGDNNVSQESNDDANITIAKPMMVVTPAVNPAVTPRNKSITPNRSNRHSVTFTSPAIAVIDRLLSMSANNSLLGQDTTMTHANREQADADLALTQLRELLAEKEISVYNLRSESKELKDRLASMETQVSILEADGQKRLKKINELNERLIEKTKINKSMAAVVEEYERTIASLIAETEQDRKRNAEERIRLIKERDEQTAHLASMDVSFRDLHSKYEKCKQVILACKANEDTYKKSIKNFEENVTKLQTNYETLKNHATSKLDNANQELEKMNRTHEAEVVKLNVMMKRKCIHITSLEETLAQKTKANEELTAICDELINKVG